MKKNLPAILISVFTVLIVVGIAVLAVKQSPSTPSTPGNAPTVGSKEINFSLPDLNNKTYSLSSFVGKEPVMVEFFAVWCPHCQRMAPIMESLSKTYDGKIQFLNVQASQYGKNYERGDMTPATIDDLKWFQSNFGITYPILKDQNANTANVYGVQGFPTYYVIDKTGKITYTASGEESENTLISEINKVISK